MSAKRHKTGKGQSTPHPHRAGGRQPQAKVVLSVHIQEGDASSLLKSFADGFGYPIEPAPEELRAILGGAESDGVGVVPVEIVDRELLVDEWSSFSSAASVVLKVFTVECRAGLWQMRGTPQCLN